MILLIDLTKKEELNFFVKKKKKKKKNEFEYYVNNTCYLGRVPRIELGYTMPHTAVLPLNYTHLHIWIWKFFLLYKIFIYLFY